MHPRTVFIFVGAILLLGFGARWVVYHYNLLPLNKEMVLRQAVALTVTYPVDPLKTRLETTSRVLGMVPGLGWAGVSSPERSVTISRPEDVEDLLASLRLLGGSRDNEFDPMPPPGGPGDPRNWQGRSTTITFHFPDGKPYTMTFDGPRMLDQQRIEAGFAERLGRVVSQLEGKQVDLFPDRWRDHDGRFRPDGNDPRFRPEKF